MLQDFVPANTRLNSNSVPFPIFNLFRRVVSAKRSSTEFQALSFCSCFIDLASGNICQYLGSFGLGGTHAYRTIGSLSGGERMSLCFATVLAEELHVLVLDEPINHWGIERLYALSIALHNHKGAVIIVSHNQGFLSGLWVVDDDRTVDILYKNGESFASGRCRHLVGRCILKLALCIKKCCRCC